MEGWIRLAECDVSWCVRRLPKAVVDACMTGNVTVAGGFIRSCIAREDIADIDLFVSSKDEAITLANKLQGDGERRPYETENAFSIKNDAMGLPVQVIHRWVFDKPEDVVPSFDFTIARAAIWFDGTSKAWTSIADTNYYRDLSAKRLTYCCPIRNEDAGGSLLRVLKFYQRGYRIPLDSLGAVISRLVMAVRNEGPGGGDEAWTAKVITGLLYEVDPNTGVPVAYED
jgi:hypothetical protein